MSGKDYVVVVGAVNIDICGKSSEQLVMYDSNPGISHISFGGVGRNIAENLCRLGANTEMITVLGDDIYSRELIAASESFGISFKHSMHIKGGNCSTYICINNFDGDMSLAVNDMDLYNLMTIDFIKSKLDVIRKAKLVAIDSNMPEEIIDFIADNTDIPIFADPVSTKKASRLKNIMGRITYIKPNIYETEVLTGVKIDNKDDVVYAAKYLLSKGVKNIFISMGGEGVYYTDGKKSGICPCVKNNIVNTTGCGDAFIAAAIWAIMNKCNIEEMVKAGQAAAAICVESEDTINADICEKKIFQLMDKVKTIPTSS